MKLATFAMTTLLSLGLLSGCAHIKPKADQGDNASATTNMRDTADWTGIYEGVLPCNGCPGIQTTITLRNNLTFSLASVYLGESAETEYSTEGQFVWKSDTIIDLAGGQLLEVSPGEVNLLTATGERVTGEIADSYRLTKKP